MGAIINKVDVALATIDEEIKNDLYELGKAYFEKNCDNESAELSEQMKSIKEREEKRNLLVQYGLKLDGKLKCSSCNEIIPGDSLFCNKCGVPVKPVDYTPIMSIVSDDAQTDDAATEEKSEVNKCPVCGNEVVDGALFCENCGARLGEGESVEEANKITTCPTCGRTIEDGAMFCEGCGTKLR